MTPLVEGFAGPFFEFLQLRASPLGLFRIIRLFHLQHPNPREAQALLVLKQWQERGYSTRHILTDSLIRFQESDGIDDSVLPVDEITYVLKQIREQLERIQRLTSRLSALSPEKNTLLPEAFLGSVRQAARPGIQLDD